MYWYGDQSPTEVSAPQVSKVIQTSKSEAPPATPPSSQSSPSTPFTY
jgi:hypothetical protein